MTAAEVKASLAKAARRCWPNVTKASDLPFPDYWKAVTEWLTFQAPHVGDALMWKLIDDFAVSAKEAEESGLKPAAPKVSDKVKDIWQKAEAGGDTTRNFEGTIHALTGPAQPAILTDRSKASTCGDSWRDSALISQKQPSPFGAPFSGPWPGALKRTKRMMTQGSLGSC